MAILTSQLFWTLKLLSLLFVGMILFGEQANSQEPPSRRQGLSSENSNGPEGGRSTRRERTAKPSPLKLTPEEIDQLKSELDVVWYRPDYTRRERGGLRGIVISGKTRPGARVMLQQRRIVRITEDQGAEYVEVTRENVHNLPVTADGFGLFYFELYIKEGHYQVPIVIFDPKARHPETIMRYQLSFYVEKDRIRLASDEEMSTFAFSPFLKRSNRISVGYGANYLSYQKSVPEFQRDIRFGSVKAPAFFVDYWRRFNPRFELSLSYKIAPGSTTSSEEVVVVDGDYSWSIGTLDLMYFPDFLFFEKSQSYRLRIGARVGGQRHTVPFLRSIEVGSANQQMATTPLTLLAMGFHAELETSPEWKYEMFMRYQLPLSSGDLFELGSTLAFDGSVGAMYNFPNYIWGLGVFWYGQLHSYQFSEFDKSDEVDVSGKQNLFFSNLELRLMYNF